MSVNDADWDTEGSRERSRLRIVVDQYRALLYTFAATALLAAIGAVIDVAVGPMTDDTELAHQIAGLLGAAAGALGICLLCVTVLWAVLAVTDR
jgi:hypothetical protein